MACARCGQPTFGPICAACKGERYLSHRPQTFALLGYQDPSGKDLVASQNDSIYVRMSLLVRALEEMALEMRNLQPMSNSLLKVSTSCKKLAAEIEEETIRRKGMHNHE